MEGVLVTNRNLTSLLFRIWIKLLNRPFGLDKLRPLWQEVRRFVQQLQGS